ncbi:hypothetical protein [Microvirga roseola]|uniref:hypothetical protein n=1 Tax=Microvirga roseola TaxID=2883126 RepID=UPI001E57EB24|nr:hypothetical protein [Microvirga roseola]
MAESTNVIKIGVIQKTWALARRMLNRPARDADVRTPSDGRRDPERQSLGVEGSGLAVAFKASAFSSPDTAESEADASLSSHMRHEILGHATDMNASLDALAEQMLAIAEIVSAQEKEIKALKARGQQLEEHDQAIMVAFTTFFHVLAAKRIARLEEISAILHNIIGVAQHEAYPQESIRLLQRLATMLHEQSATGAAEVQVHRSPASENNAA